MPGLSCSAVYVYHISNCSFEMSSGRERRLIRWLMLPGAGGFSYLSAWARVASFIEYRPFIDPWVPAKRNVPVLSMGGPQLRWSMALTCGAKFSRTKLGLRRSEERRVGKGWGCWGAAG